MKAELTHVKQIKAADAKDMETICTLLNWTVEQYCEHQFYTYLTFMKRRFYNQPVQLLNQVMYSKTMRGFWNNEWSKRNQLDFLPHALDLDTHSQSYVDDQKGLMLCWDYSAYESFMVDEYMYVHATQILITDREFLTRLDNTLTLILNK